MDKKLLKALNEQIKNEFYSEKIYLSMAAFFGLMELKGFSHWLKKQALEEHSHALKIYDFVLERDQEIELLAIEAGPKNWSSPMQVFETALAHEQKVTKMIDKLYELALSEKDYATKVFLEWFVSEQVEEEATAREILGKIKMANDSKQGLLLLDMEMEKRK